MFVYICITFLLFVILKQPFQGPNEEKNIWSQNMHLAYVHFAIK